MNKNREIIRQILIITDMKPDEDICSIEAALKAKDMGITVNAISIIDNKESYAKGAPQVETISKAGGGLWDYCSLQDLGMVMQKMTQKTINNGLEYIVSKQLKSAIGQSITDVEPKSRMKIVKFLENYGDRVDLLYAFVLDTGKSMENKLPLAKSCIEDLMELFSARKGISKIALISYQGDDIDGVKVVCGFTDEKSALIEGLKLIKAGEVISTGADKAVETAVKLISDTQAVTEKRIIRPNVE